MAPPPHPYARTLPPSRTFLDLGPAKNAPMPTVGSGEQAYPEWVLEETALSGNPKIN